MEFGSDGPGLDVGIQIERFVVSGEEVAYPMFGFACKDLFGGEMLFALEVVKGDGGGVHAGEREDPAE